jgi:predicted nucleic acid-binding protein
MDVALDTNILAYAEGIDDAIRRDAAQKIIGQLPQEKIVLPAQVLGEFYNVLRRKGGRTPAQARNDLARWSASYPVLATTKHSFTLAADLAALHHFSIWDAVIFCTASIAGCGLLLSEDMQDGFTWGGVTVVDPFAENPHPLLTSLLAR